MAKEFAKAFYKSDAWEQTREAYRRSVDGLCEECLAKGIYNPGVIVHHKIHLTPDNIGDPEVTLGWGNLMLVCRDCHARIHSAKKRRYKVDELGRIAPI